MLIDFIKLSFIKFIRNKKNIFYVLILSIFTVILLSLITFEKSLVNYIDNFIVKNIGFRTLSVSPKNSSKDLGYSELVNIEHVVDVHSANYDTASVESSFKTEDLDGYVDFVYANQNTLPNVIIGEKFNASDTGVAICPIDFLPSSEAYNLLVSESKILSGYKLLNSSFEAYYFSYIFDYIYLLIFL